MNHPKPAAPALARFDLRRGSSLAARRQRRQLEHSPAVHVRRPRLDYESHAIGLDRNEVGALLVAAGLGAASEHALISLLAINGPRISDALGADIDPLGIERGHRTLTILRNGGKIVTIPSHQKRHPHADPRTTMRYDRARVSLDRHATYIVAAYLAGATPINPTRCRAVQPSGAPLGADETGDTAERRGGRANCR